MGDRVCVNPQGQVVQVLLMLLSGTEAEFHGTILMENGPFGTLGRLSRWFGVPSLSLSLLLFVFGVFGCGSQIFQY